MKKFITSVIAAIIVITLLASCSGSGNSITVISREDGSGTRSAFVELLGITDSDGHDMTSATAEITNSTSVMLASIAGNKHAIGYVSLGSLSDSVKAVSVDGVAATVANVNNGSYKLSRPFNIAYKDGKLTELAKDFISYIMSADGQKIISNNGYISVLASTEAYKAAGITGKLVLAGSTSVSPVMEKLADAYKKLNSGVTIEVQQSGSSAGMTSALKDTCDIGMASRDLKESELKELTSKTIAKDGIAVIVNHDNALNNLTSAQIKDVFSGAVSLWSDLK